MNTRRPRITDYAHYSLFLKDRFHDLKLGNPKFSYGYCARKLGSNASYLKHVLEGRRKIGLSRISKVAEVFELDDFEREYFTLQVIRDLIKDPGSREYLTQVLSRLSFERHNAGPLASARSLECTSFPVHDWLHLALIELVSFPDFSDDPNWIRGHLIDGEHLSVGNVKSAMKALLDRRILEREGGRYVLKKTTLVTPDPFDGDSFKSYRGVVGKVWEALGDAGRYRRNHFFQAIASIDGQAEAEILKAAEEFRDKVVAIARRPAHPTKLMLISSNLLNLLKK